MPLPTPLRSLAPVLALALLAGCLGAPAPAAGTGEAAAAAPQAEVADAVTLRAFGGYHEVNVEMGEGASLTYAFNATGPLSWDLHSHGDEGVRTWAEGRDAEASGSFTAPAAGVYSLYLRNPGQAPVEASFQVRGHFRIATD